MLLSSDPPRLLWVRIAVAKKKLADRILRSIAETSQRDRTPWSVYDFTGSVPRAFRLAAHRFAVGRMSLTFRDGRKSLTFERWTPNDDRRQEEFKNTGSSDDTTINHNGHTITVTRQRAARLWDRLAGRSGFQAAWDCPESKRRYRINSLGPTAEPTLHQAITHLTCHRPPTDATVPG